MNRFPQVALAMVTIALACSRPGGRAADSATPNADSINAATVKATPAPVAPAPSPPAAPTGTKSGRKVSTPPSTRPHLTRLSPSSGSLASGTIIEVEIVGERFTATGNSIFFGPVNLGEVPSRDGRTVHFAIPQTFPSRSEVPPMTVQPGVYRVYVVNSGGTSDTLTFTIKGDNP